MAQEKQEIIVYLAQEDKATICNLQNKLNENSDKLSDNIDKLDNCIRELKTSSDNSRIILQEIFDETIKNKIDEFDSIFNKRARRWCLYTICSLLAITIGIVICLIFNKRWCLNIEDTSFYCLTAICIVSIIGCILVHKEYIQSKWINNIDS